MTDDQLEFFFRLPPEQEQKSYWQGTEVAGCIILMAAVIIGMIIGVGIHMAWTRFF